ncbi:uncharacterized protein MONOS_530 [Monocercomonoides exilis]|uniref:uncharacterized protein n=1 Tax=Monocercomonoides exilis TaxID=2049356 RepID=UPI0035594F20|nr:hypothetical protein MONOS_530 [Monocercomonoides exilis]|eukprot:MONOS_530.1-p1 / transcript=MONOS_530.1 / gene=MONOS_530 / organism=Monocercomonoides_exilis_PA203 / gene_product=unspecified product / transcript_product=unspecified product / location=Mono_scaffold00008:181929-192128(-) / protein_length=3326 / sequence_SO=supercontig / SO=protein_coding / is_pseudo=false
MANCSCTSGNGGAIAVSISESGIFNPFSEESAKGAEKSAVSEVIPLVYYLKDRESFVSLANNGSDTTACGFELYPCKTVGYALSQQTGARSILISDNYNFEECVAISITSGCLLSGSSSNSHATIVGGTTSYSEVVSIGKGVTIQKIIFQLPNSLKSGQPTVFSVADALGGNFTVKQSTIQSSEAESAVSYSFVSVSAGTLHLSDVIAASMTFNDKPFVNCTGSNSKANISSFNATTITYSGNDGFIRISEAFQMTLSQSSFEKFVSSKSSVIDIRSAKDSKLEGSNFTDISLQSGEGGIMRANMLADQSLKIEGGQFGSAGVHGNGGGMMISMETNSILRVGVNNLVNYHSCQALLNLGQGGLGGGIFLDLRGAADNFVVTHVEFDSCLADTSGNNLFITASNFTKVINSTTLNFSFNDFDEKALSGYENNDNSYSIPLVLYLQSPPSPVYVGGDNKHNFERCGYNGHSCITIEYALNAWQTIQPLEVIISGITQLRSELAFADDKHFVFEGAADGGELEILGNTRKTQDGLINNTANISFKILKFSLPLKMNDRTCVFLSQNGQLSIESCEFVATSDSRCIEYSLVMCSAGICNLFNLKVNDGTFNANSAFMLNGSCRSTIDQCLMNLVKSALSNTLIMYSSQDSLSISNSNFTFCTFEDGAAIRDENGKSLTLKNTLFQNLTRKVGNGSALYANLWSGSSVVVSDVKTEGCITQKGCGGGILAILQGTAHFHIGKGQNETGFLRCGASGADSIGGYGGGLLMKLEDEVAKDIAFSQIVFGKDEEKNFASVGGNDMFIEAMSFSGIVKRETLNFSFAIDVDENPNLQDMMGYQNEDANNMIPLVLFLRTFSSSCFVDSDGRDYYLCGFHDYPCMSISYGGSNRFNAEKAAICLLPSFVFMNQTSLSTQDMLIDVEEADTQIKVASNGSGAGDFMISTSREISFRKIAFVLPTSFSLGRRALFGCSGSVLVLNKCSASVETENVNYSLVIITGGSLKITQLCLSHIYFAQTSAFEVKGSTTSGVFDEMSFENVRSNSQLGLITVGEGAYEQLINSNITSATFDNQSLLNTDGLASIMMSNNTFAKLVREVGCGAVISGTVGNKMRMDTTNCTFSEITGQETFGKGGSLFVTVVKGGTFLFDTNIVRESCVDSQDGFGGGLHLTFTDASVSYSMKNDNFESNDAHLGKDVYLVCPSPRSVLNGALWTGSLSEYEDKEKYWVFDGTSTPSVDASILIFLFPAGPEIVFVDGSKSNGVGCGIEAVPCRDVNYGFNIMSNGQTTIKIVGDTSLNTLVKRNLSLTIQGSGAVYKSVVVESNGSFCIDDSSLYLAISHLSFVFSSDQTQSNGPELFYVRSGLCTVTNCEFSAMQHDSNIVTRWIVNAIGGTTSLTNIIISHLSFSTESGIGNIQKCTFSFENITITEVISEDVGLIIAKDTNVLFKGMKLSKCSLSNGSAIRLQNETVANIQNGSSFEECFSDLRDGGAISCELCVEEGSLSISDCTITKCEANERSRKGGGIYLKTGALATNNFILSRILFSDNKALSGKDLFVVCNNLNETIVPTRFDLLLLNENGSTAVDVKGTDENHFNQTDQDLLFFLVQHKSNVIYLSFNGYDALGCGTSEHPCNSVWRGFNNLDENSTNKLFLIDTLTFIQNPYNFTSISITSSLNEERSTLVFRNFEQGTSAEYVARCGILLNFESLQLSIYNSISPNTKTLITSIGKLTLSNCSFAPHSSSVIDFSLITASSGQMEIKNCEIFGMTFLTEPFVLSVAANISGSEFSCISTPAGTKGGVICGTMRENEIIKFSNCVIKNCSCSLTNGKGGFCNLDCNKSTEEFPFEFGELVFESNEAALGKNAFITVPNLNRSVTKHSFNFNFDSMISDPNLFVGCDSTFNNTDLFRFLVGYKNWAIHLSSMGYDVMRCGNEDDPCCTFWKGMQQINTDAPLKVISIDKQTILQNSFDFSNFTIQSAHSELIDEPCIISISNNLQAADSLMMNRESLLFMFVKFSISETFSGGDNAIVLSKRGVLSFSDCWIEMKSALQSPAIHTFARAEDGELTACRLRCSSLTGIGNIFSVSSSVMFTVQTNIFERLSLNDGCVVAVHQATTRIFANSGSPLLTLINSSFINISRIFAGASVISVDQITNKLSLRINSSTFRDCKSTNSIAGGAVAFELMPDSSFDLSNSEVEQCVCSTSAGRGGGIYIKSSIRSSLSFLFYHDTFDSNIADVGRDIFIRCFDIKSQINETQFQFDLRESKYNRLNAIFGIDEHEYSSQPVNLIEFVVTYQADIIFVTTNSSRGGEDTKKCGTQQLPCLSLAYAASHLTFDFKSQLVVMDEGKIDSELDLSNLMLTSRSFEQVPLEVALSLQTTRENLIECTSSVTLSLLSLLFLPSFNLNSTALLHIEEGTLSTANCSFSGPEQFQSANSLLSTLFKATNGNILFENVKIASLSFSSNVISSQMFSSIKCNVLTMRYLMLESSAVEMDDTSSTVAMEKINMKDICIASGSAIVIQHRQGSNIESNFKPQYSIQLSSIENVTTLSNEASSFAPTFLSVSLSSASSEFTNSPEIFLSNCSVRKSISSFEKGSALSVSYCLGLTVESCQFDGFVDNSLINSFEVMNEKNEEMCRWNGSLVHFEDSCVRLRDTTISNSRKGGLSLMGGALEIEKCEFTGNDPMIENYSSIRRNILCDGDGSVNLMSVKGGDGASKDSCMWLLDDGCKAKGILESYEEMGSLLFVPRITSIDMEHPDENETDLTFHGRLLIPCNLSFEVVSTMGSEKSVETYYFSEDGYVNEKTVKGTVPSASIKEAPSNAEVSAAIMFGKLNSPSQTVHIVLRNKTENKISEGVGNNNEALSSTPSSMMIVVVVLAVFLLFVIVAVVILAMRWRKAKNRNEELEEIVADTVKKDPKAFEMITMEMSPEERWRRTEREAEKKNEERIKKRVYAKSLQHSESSEHLLSESGSTEYILGRDSDKIPEWALEKVEEDNDDDDVETRKRSPSPSISSTSTISTTDTDTTFIRGEDLCPTTSSMSNLVDAMACSSPHEKLIVDLRDSLFMMLHGRNEKKEMAIGTIEEREHTASHILFWVANLALHSFDETEEPLQSLASLSPHLILFSEHMLICVAMHTDCSSSSDDSDSSSVSSFTIVTSSSDCSSVYKNCKGSPPPSSAFEDEDNYKNECMRWKAPELMNGSAARASKKSVAFSIGMMLWECLTLKIPFGEYEAEIAGNKIVNGERPGLGKTGGSTCQELIIACMSPHPDNRPTLTRIKREFAARLPAGAAMLTATDALIVETSSVEFPVRRLPPSALPKSAATCGSETEKQSKSNH